MKILFNIEHFRLDNLEHWVLILESNHEQGLSFSVLAALTAVASILLVVIIFGCYCLTLWL